MACWCDDRAVLIEQRRLDATQEDARRKIEARTIDSMIRQGRNSEEIATATGVKEHFIIGEMKDRAEAAEEAEIANRRSR
jgi:hypothetical protein